MYTYAQIRIYYYITNEFVDKCIYWPISCFGCFCWKKTNKQPLTNHDHYYTYWLQIKPKGFRKHEQIAPLRFTEKRRVSANIFPKAETKVKKKL